MTSDETLTKLEAAAEALAQCGPDQKLELQRDYLELVAQFMRTHGAGQAASSPLFDLIEQLDEAEKLPSSQERRTGVYDCSDELLAKVAAVIDVLVSAGFSSDHASQIVTRQLIAKGVRIPPGGDARAWRNIQAWRHKLINTKREGPIWRTYSVFKEDLPKRYGTQLAEAAARDAIWDRRSKKPA